MALSAGAQSRVLVMRLKPGQDLKREIQALVEHENLQAGYILTAVGSLNVVSLRLANQADARTYRGPHEIVSLVGTLSPDGLHLHMAASDSEGHTVGGHLVDGNIVYTTVELVIGVPDDLRFHRVLDPATGSKEIEVQRIK